MLFIQYFHFTYLISQEARMELELKEERLAAATRELEERGGGGDELTALRRNKTELERRVRDQEEELDELAGQIQVSTPPWSPFF